MSLFAKHISASRKGGRVSVNLRNEDIDPLNGVVADAPVDTEVDEGPEEGTESDKFAAQRALLNRRHGMIRNRRFRQEEVIDEVDGEDEVVIADDGEGDADVEITDGEEVVVDAPEGEDEVLEVTSEDDDEEEVSVEVEDEADDEVVEEESEESDDEASDDELVDEVEEDVAEIEDLETEMQMLHDSMIAIESFGINPTAMAVMQTTGLLDGTALESLGLESFGFEAPSSAETQMALEALGDKVKEKAAAWSSKIVSATKNAGSKVLSVLNKIWGGITGSIKFLGSATWNGVKETGRAIKAHPYKTIAAVVVAIAAVGGVIAFGGASFPVGSKADALQGFFKSLAAKVNAIKWPFGKFGAKATENGIQLLTSADSTKVDVVNNAVLSASKAGWTKSAVKAVSGKASSAYNAVIDGAKSFFTVRTAKIVGLGTAAGANVSGSVRSHHDQFVDIKGGIDKIKDGEKKAGVKQIVKGAFITPFTGYFKGVWAAIKFYVKIIRVVVVGGLRAIAKTFNALVGLVKKSEPAAA